MRSVELWTKRTIKLNYFCNECCKYYLIYICKNVNIENLKFVLKIVSPKVKLPAPVLRVLPGYRLSCSATGTRPIYIALIRDSTLLIYTTHYYAKIEVNEEANYTCVATNQYGNDVGEVSVIFTGKKCEIALFQVVFIKCNFRPFLNNI